MRSLNLIFHEILSIIYSSNRYTNSSEKYDCFHLFFLDDIPIDMQTIKSWQISVSMKCSFRNKIVTQWRHHLINSLTCYLYSCECLFIHVNNTHIDCWFILHSQADWFCDSMSHIIVVIANDSLAFHSLFNQPHIRRVFTYHVTASSFQLTLKIFYVCLYWFPHALSGCFFSMEFSSVCLKTTCKTLLEFWKCISIVLK